MKRLFLTLSLVFMSVAAVATAQAQPTKNYLDPGAAFALRIPGDWKAKRTPLEDRGWLTLIGTGNDEDAGVAVLVFTLPTPVSPELEAQVLPQLGQTLIDAMLQLMRTQGAVTASKVAPVRFGARNALRCDVTFRPKAGVKGGPQRGYLLALLGQSNAVLLAASAPQNDAAGWKKAQKTAATLAIESERPANPPNLIAAARPQTGQAPGDAASPAGAPQPGGTPPAITESQLNAAVREAGQELDKALPEMAELGRLQRDLAFPEAAGAPLKLGPARAAFAAQERQRLAAKAGTPARVRAAGAAMQAAAKVAWAAYDAGQFEQSATWFARRAALKKDVYQNARDPIAARVAKTAALLDTLHRAWASAPQNIKADLGGVIESLILLQGQRLMLLEALAYGYNDPLAHIRWSQQRVNIQKTGADLLAARLRDKPDTPESLQERYAAQEAVARLAENFATAVMNRALYAQAQTLLLQALELRRQLPADYGNRNLHRAHKALGDLYYYMGDMAKARSHYEQALAAHRESAQQRRKVVDDLEAATQQAPQFEMQGVAAANEVIEQTIILRDLGQVAAESGDLKTALSFYGQALTAIEALPKTGAPGELREFYRGISLEHLADVHLNSGEVDRALQEWREAARIHRAQGNDELAASALQGIARALREKGDLKGAAVQVRQARRVFMSAQNLPGVISATLSLARSARDMGQLAAAAQLAQEGLVMARATGSGAAPMAVLLLSDIRLRQKQPAAALRLLQQAEASLQRIGWRADISISAADLRGRILEAQKNNAGALASYQKAVALIEGVRGTAASESAFADLKGNYTIYERIVRLLIKMGRAEQAFEYLSRAKSKQLQEVLRLSSIKTPDAALQALLDRSAGLEARLRSTQAQLQSEQTKPQGERDPAKIQNLQQAVAATQREFYQVSDQIKKANPNLNDSFSAEQMKDARRKIPPGVIFVRYMPAGEQLYIFLVARDKLKIYAPKVRPAELWARVRAFRKLMDDAKRRAADGQSIAIADWMSDDPHTAALRENITALHAMLIAPIEAELADMKTVMFWPDQLLFYLPMQALAKEQNGRLRFLIEDKQVAYIAANNFVKVLLHDTAQLGSGLVAVGNPAGADLPAALEEANIIAGIFPASQVLSGAQATKSTLTDEKNLGKRILHFATHGVLNAAQPDESYILLARGATSDDAQLTFKEVQGLDLEKTDLVTISACQTALGQRNPTGIEVSSLATSFSRGGAQTVVASLWSVSDESTRDLMVEFYRQLAAGKGKAEALREAELKVMKTPKYNHPFHWSPFILMGDWR